MKKIIWIFIALIAMTSVNLSAQKGEKTMGILGGYNTRNQSGIAGIFFQYRFSKYFRLSPDIQYTFQHKGLSAFQINGNAHFPLRLDSRLNFYPLVGITYTSWKESVDGSNNNYNKFGANIGGGFEYMAMPTMKIFIEGKYNWIQKLPSGAISLGIGYIF